MIRTVCFLVLLASNDFTTKKGNSFCNKQRKQPKHSYDRLHVKNLQLILPLFCNKRSYAWVFFDKNLHLLMK